jgi:hypothetical protein
VGIRRRTCDHLLEALEHVVTADVDEGVGARLDGGLLVVADEVADAVGQRGHGQGRRGGEGEALGHHDEVLLRALRAAEAGLLRRRGLVVRADLHGSKLALVQAHGHEVAEAVLWSKCARAWGGACGATGARPFFPFQNGTHLGEALEAVVQQVEAGVLRGDLADLGD